jgi:surface antigen
MAASKRPSLLEWLSTRLHVATDVDGVYGAQCTDLVNDYLHAVYGAPRVRGNAVDMYLLVPAGWRLVPNGPTNAPSAGAVVHWYAGTSSQLVGEFGHVAVAIVASSDWLLSVDQNWAGVRAASLVDHSYRQVRGWWEPPGR